ncbi:MAG: hypothetical protein WCO07_01505 [bacterium]
MTTERQEIRIKKALLDFVNKEIVIQGLPNLVSDRKHELVNLLYGLFLEFNKYTNPPKLDKN